MPNTLSPRNIAGVLKMGKPPSKLCVPVLISYTTLLFTCVYLPHFIAYIHKASLSFALNISCIKVATLSVPSVREPDPSTRNCPGGGQSKDLKDFFTGANILKPLYLLHSPNLPIWEND